MKRAKHSPTDYNKAYNQALNTGDMRAALKYAYLAYKHTPQIHEHKLRLANNLKDASFQTFDPGLKITILKLLQTRGLDHQKLWKAWLSLLMQDPAMQALNHLYNKRPCDLAKLQKSLKDTYFVMGLERMIIFDMRFEETLKELHNLIQSHKITSKAFEKTLALYNANTEGLIYEEGSDNSLVIDGDIETLSLPKNDVHKDVRDQYEANPYPRWLSSDTPLNPDFATYTRLVAGCGTGYGLCQTALQYPNAQITAIDLSLSSMSYARKKARALGIQNIAFYQADILDLKKLSGPFDVIECSGVLHHMADPLEGWRALLAKLKPHGKMHIGLYSELGRADIIAARKVIADKEFESTPTGIYAARKHLASLSNDHLARNVLKRRDFYSLSSCRDLLFHVKEENFTIAKITHALKGLNLKFTGFNLHNPQTASLYRKDYPDDTNMLNLHNWEKFEANHPETFRGMYQFWCEREE